MREKRTFLQNLQKPIMFLSLAWVEGLNEQYSQPGGHYPDQGPCQSNKRAQVAEPELSLFTLCPLLAGLPSKEYSNQAGLGFPLGEGKNLHVQK